MRTMNTERLFKVTAADMSGNVIERYVEPGPGKLAYFTEQQARSLLVWSLRTGSYLTCAPAKSQSLSIHGR